MSVARCRYESDAMTLAAKDQTRMNLGNSLRRVSNFTKTVLWGTNSLE
ncbi:MAG: hypothetical protein ACLVL2_07370 [Bacteroides cellulosilyticus]